LRELHIRSTATPAEPAAAPAAIVSPHGA
jgi:hypothetical protein